MLLCYSNVIACPAEYNVPVCECANYISTIILYNNDNFHSAFVRFFLPLLQLTLSSFNFNLISCCLPLLPPSAVSVASLWFAYLSDSLVSDFIFLVSPSVQCVSLWLILCNVQLCWPRLDKIAAHTHTHTQTKLIQDFVHMIARQKSFTYSVLCLLWAYFESYSTNTWFNSVKHITNLNHECKD